MLVLPRRLVCFVGEGPCDQKRRQAEFFRVNRPPQHGIPAPKKNTGGPARRHMAPRLVPVLCHPVACGRGFAEPAFNRTQSPNFRRQINAVLASSRCGVLCADVAQVAHEAAARNAVLSFVDDNAVHFHVI